MQTAAPMSSPSTTGCRAACRPPTTRPAGGRHSRNSRRSSRRADTRATWLEPLRRPRRRGFLHPYGRTVRDVRAEIKRDVLPAVQTLQHFHGGPVVVAGADALQLDVAVLD